MTAKSIQINRSHITRVEGHGNIVVDVEDGVVRKVEWQVPEAPRFFEAMVVGRDWSELSRITSRICGICSIGHTFASLKATEAAMGISITEQTERFRQILTHGENLQSHILHVCYLVLPDLLKVDSIVPLVETHRETILLAVGLHRLANDTCDMIGGRTTHPIRATVNGWSMLPRKKELLELRERYLHAMDDLKTLAEVFHAHADVLPQFERETEYVCLTNPHEYAVYDGQIKTSDEVDAIPVSEYLRVTNEYVNPQSTAKWTRFHRDSYAVGALARYNNNAGQLPEAVKSLARQLGLSVPCHNPFMNNAAQVMECLFSAQKIIEHLDWLLDKELSDEDGRFEVGEGRGVGAVEVPRGILFHDYTYDKNGKCVKANMVIPTNQNHANIQRDMEEMVPQIKDRPQEEIQLNLEMLVRAYDPCISCSTHCIDLRVR
jgi:sulfhydrogenase subunit alpha